MFCMSLEQINKFFTTFILNIELTWRLFFDMKVPLLTKILFIGFLSVYLVSPIDLIPDILPVVGQVDDIFLFVFFMLQFIKACPENVVEYHKNAIFKGDWKLSFFKHLITTNK